MGNIDYKKNRVEAFTYDKFHGKAKAGSFSKAIFGFDSEDIKKSEFPKMGERTPFYLDENGEVMQPYHQCAWCKAITLNSEVVANDGKLYKGSHGICKGCLEVQNRIIERRYEKVC